MMPPRGKNAPEMGFNERVYLVVSEIPRGRVAGYADVAAILGSPRAARQVGWALSALERRSAGNPGDVPWQRVIRSSGTIALQGEPGRGLLQRTLLEEEGIVFDGDRVDMARFRWDPRSADLTELFRRLYLAEEL
jgi:methylated-DNA-protein-cysteine methyltransferase related protein